MTAFQTLISLVMVGFAAAAAAQTGGTGLRGSTPPGQSQDGAAPSEGAIKGGSTTKAPTTEGVKRCYELSGTLREQCLLQEQGASTGGTKETDEKPAGPTVRDPLTAPPPLNPLPVNPR